MDIKSVEQSDDMRKAESGSGDFGRRRIYLVIRSTAKVTLPQVGQIKFAPLEVAMTKVSFKKFTVCEVTVLKFGAIKRLLNKRHTTKVRWNHRRFLKVYIKENTIAFRKIDANNLALWEANSMQSSVFYPNVTKKAPIECTVGKSNWCPILIWKFTTLKSNFLTLFFFIRIVNFLFAFHRISQIKTLTRRLTLCFL